MFENQSVFHGKSVLGKCAPRQCVSVPFANGLVVTVRFAPLNCVCGVFFLHATELGAGVGLCGLVAAYFADKGLCTTEGVAR